MLHHPPQANAMTAFPTCRRAPVTLPSSRPNLRFSSFQKSVHEIPFPFGKRVGAGFSRPVLRFFVLFMSLVVKDYHPIRSSFVSEERIPPPNLQFSPFVPQKTPKIIFLLKFIPLALSQPAQPPVLSTPAGYLFLICFFKNKSPFLFHSQSLTKSLFMRQAIGYNCTDCLSDEPIH